MRPAHSLFTTPIAENLYVLATPATAGKLAFDMVGSLAGFTSRSGARASSITSGPTIS